MPRKKMAQQIHQDPHRPADAVLPPAQKTFDSRAHTSLNLLPHGVAARVVSIRGGSAVSRRLMEMGVVPGAPVRVIKAAPLGDPIEVRVHSYHLALRRTEAQAITVVANDE